MGDRRMVEIRGNKGSLYVFTYGHGALYPDMAKAAIVAACSRWDDETYAIQIIVDQLTKPGRDSTLGFGLMLEPSEEDSYNHDKPSIIIDLVYQLLLIRNSPYERFEHTSFSDLMPKQEV